MSNIFALASRRVLRPGLLGCALALAGQAAASAPESAEALAVRARAAEDELEYEEASSLWLRVLLVGGISEEQRIEAYVHAGRIAVLLERGEEANAHFREVLGRDPDFQLPASDPPRVRDQFEAVRRQVLAERAPPVAEPPAAVVRQEPQPQPPQPRPEPPPTAAEEPGQTEELPLLLASGGAVAGAGAVALVFGGVMGIMSLQAHEAAETSNVQLEAEARYGERDTLAIVANVGYASGAAMLLGGAGLVGASLLMEAE